MAGLNFIPADTTVTAVSEAWVQDNADRYAWTKLPRTRVNAIDNGYSPTTTYELSDVARFLLDGRGGIPWSPGQSPPDLADQATVSVTVTAQGKATPNIDGRPLRSSAPRDASVEQLVPGQLAVAYQMIENDLASHLIGSDYTTQTWSAVLDTGNAEPLRELNNKLLPFHKYMGSRYKLIAIGDARVFAILASYTDFHGAGVGSNSPSFASSERVRTTLGEFLGIEEVHVIRAAQNSAKRGQTKTVSDIGGGLLWIGLVDRSPSYDLTSLSSLGPDGGLAVAMGSEPYVETWEDRGASYEYFHGRTQYDIFAPRTASGPVSGKWGMFFPTAQNIT